MQLNRPRPLTYECPDIEERHARLRELMVYVSRTCAKDPTYDLPKLTTILFHTDFLSYRRYGHPMTGVAYMRLSEGPTPQALTPLCQEMEAQGEIAFRRVTHTDHDTHQMIPLRAPDIDRFSPRDLEMVDDIIRVFWGRTARDVSERSHGRAWRIAPDGALIPYEAAFLSEDGVTPDDIRRARALIREHGWDV